MIVTFCGHKEKYYSSALTDALERRLRDILETDPRAVFYLGDYGDFDLTCNRVLRDLQGEYPHLRRIFVTPYLAPNYAHLNLHAEHYDEVLYPFTEKVMPRFAISKRNRWMVDQADLVIACVDYGFGGAAATLRYALGKGKRIVNLGKYAPEKN